MSARDNNNIFARWSRRKQAVRDSEIPAAEEEQDAAEEAAAEMDAERADRQLAAEKPDAGEPLPILEDLTADSDLSAFLRQGVPKALKRAALRKMWSLDPAIRDYIGPSEYAWDFNQPGSMAGFGPLDSKESVAEFLSTMSGGVRAGVAKVAELPETSEASLRTAAVSPDEDTNVPYGGPKGGSVAPAEPLAPSHAPASPEPLSSVRTDVVAESENSENPSQVTSPRRHGGAMPR